MVSITSHQQGDPPLPRLGRLVPDKATLLEWAERQRALDRPVLVVWAIEDQPCRLAGAIRRFINDTS